ncbi:MAG: trigger factor [Tannerella sp.]|jgi:trigger factor|nr:trigger factor [Tannerella sp.]
MDVSLKNSDAVSSIIKVKIEKDDYAALVDKNLHKLRQKVNMPGFRKGMVPLNIVKKLYGKYALAEEVNKLVSENLLSYIREQGLGILGEPIPNETEQKTIDFDTDENFEFYFDVAVSSDIDIQLTKKDKLNYYQIKVDDELIEKQVDSYRKHYGSYDSVEQVEADDLVKGIAVELEDGAPKPGGLIVEDASLMPSYIKSKMEQEKFVGAQPGSIIVFNPYEANNGAEAEIAAFLRIDKAQATEMKNDFTFEIKEITRYKPAELNQEFYDRVFGPDVVMDEATFRNEIKDYLAEQLAPESEYKFMEDVRTLLLKKAGNVVFAEDILKRWLLLSNEKTTKEQVDDEYPKVVEDMTYYLVKEKIVKNNIIMEWEDLEAMAKRITQAQFAQYGILSVPDDVLEKYAKDMLNKQETAKKLVNRVIEEKLSAWIKSNITVTVKEVTVEEFGKVLEEDSKAKV